MPWRRSKKGGSSFAHSCTPFHSKSLRDLFSNFHETFTVVTLSRKPKKLPAQLREVAAAARPRQSRIGRVAEPKNFAKRSKEGAGVASPGTLQFGRAMETRTLWRGRRGTRTARLTCAQCSIEPQGPKTLRRGRKEGAGIGRFRRFRFGGLEASKTSWPSLIRT
jgi:hypothetical protein